MSLSSLYLDAFKQVALEKNFSRAAIKLHITQSALSQRVINLEKEIGTALFIREAQGIFLTETGQKLLRFCQMKDSLEEEFRGELSSGTELSGIIRIGSFSSVSKSVLMPLVSTIIKENPRVQLDIKIRELRQLPAALMSSEVDFILTTEPLEKQGLENHPLGHETYQMIRSTLKKSLQNVYLDNDEFDSTTYDFLSLQGNEAGAVKRSYVDNIDSIIEGVRLGIGRAVVPQHLIQGIKGIEVVKGMKPLRVPVYLIHYSQPYTTRLHQLVKDRILSDFSRGL